MKYLRAFSILSALTLALSAHQRPAGEPLADAGADGGLAGFYSAAGEWIPFSRCDGLAGVCVPSSIRTCLETAEGCVDRMPWDPPQAR